MRVIVVLVTIGCIFVPTAWALSGITAALLLLIYVFQTDTRDFIYVS